MSAGPKAHVRLPDLPGLLSGRQVTVVGWPVLEASPRAERGDSLSIGSGAFAARVLPELGVDLSGSRVCELIDPASTPALQESR